MSAQISTPCGQGPDPSGKSGLKDDDGDGIVMPYFVNGAGGAALRAFGSSTDPDSALRYNSSHGAMLVNTTDTEIDFEFRSVSNSLVDTYTIDLNRDTTSPTLAISASDRSGNNNGEFTLGELLTLTFDFSEEVNGFEPSDIALSGRTLVAGSLAQNASDPPSTPPSPPLPDPAP
jgi:hypothetical protein